MKICVSNIDLSVKIVTYQPLAVFFFFQAYFFNKKKHRSNPNTYYFLYFLFPKVCPFNQNQLCNRKQDSANTRLSPFVEDLTLPFKRRVTFVLPTDIEVA